MVNVRKLFMQALKKNAIYVLLVIFVTTVAFIVGAALGAKYSIAREMQLHEEVLIRNLPILAECKLHECNKILQQLLVQENDAAIDQYTSLERESTNRFFLNFGHGVWSIVYTLYSDSGSVTPSKRLREYYKKMGCGLSGIICQKKSIP